MAPRLTQLTLRLPHSLTERGFDLARLLAAEPGRPWSACRALLPRFELRSHERAFALELLRRHRNHWLFRCNQTAFCGDFVLVDMSAPDPAGRTTYALELKQRERLRIDTAERSVQLANHPAALREIAAQQRIIDEQSPVRTLVGDGAAVLAYLAA